MEETQGHRAAVGALIFGSLAAGLLQTVVLQVQDDFPALLDTSRETASWIVTATILTACAFSPVSSRLGDMLGRKQVVVGLLILLAFGSLVSALSVTVWFVILGRAIQGLAIGVLPLAMSILKDLVPPAKLGGAIALTSGTLGIGSAVGLPVGALINEVTGWRGIFWVCFLLGITGAAWIHLVVPAGRIRSGGDFDGIGALGLGTGVVALLIALSQSLRWGWLSAPTLILSGGGLLTLVLTAIHLLRVQHPIIDLRSSIGSRILLTNISALLLNFSLMGAYVIFPQIMALPVSAPIGLGVDRIGAGLVMMTSGMTTALATPLITSLNSRLGPKRLMVIGSVIVGSSLGLCLLFPWTTGMILAVNIALGFGFGMSFAAMPQIIMESVGPENTAAANGLNAQSRFSGTAASAAMCAAVLAHWSVLQGETSFPTDVGVGLAIGLCSSAAVVAVVLCLLIPASPQNAPSP